MTVLVSGRVQAQTLSDQRILVSVDEWETDSPYPSGHYVRTLGAIGDRETETEVLIIENDIETRPFTEAVYACVPPLPWSVPPEALMEPGRADFRGLNVCSVDPPGCKARNATAVKRARSPGWRSCLKYASTQDIDDALHIRELGNGNVEVGVHIADVTSFLLPGTAMDEEASKRATSVYLVERRIDMLPKALTEDICSLRGGVERMTFSVLWARAHATHTHVRRASTNSNTSTHAAQEMTPDVDIVSKRFTKAVIKSVAALSYPEAQARMDDSSLTDRLTQDLRRMNALAKRLRARRSAAGALTLASPEVKFTLDTETLDPLDVGMYQVRTHSERGDGLCRRRSVVLPRWFAGTRGQPDGRGAHAVGEHHSCRENPRGFPRVRAPSPASCANLSHVRAASSGVQRGACTRLYCRKTHSLVTTPACFVRQVGFDMDVTTSTTLAVSLNKAVRVRSHSPGIVRAHSL